MLSAAARRTKVAEHTRIFLIILGLYYKTIGEQLPHGTYGRNWYGCMRRVENSAAQREKRLVRQGESRRAPYNEKAVRWILTAL